MGDSCFWLSSPLPRFEKEEGDGMQVWRKVVDYNISDVLTHHSLPHFLCCILLFLFEFLGGGVAGERWWVCCLKSWEVWGQLLFL